MFMGTLFEKDIHFVANLSYLLFVEEFDVGLWELDVGLRELVFVMGMIGMIFVVVML